MGKGTGIRPRSVGAALALVAACLAIPGPAGAAGAGPWTGPSAGPPGNLQNAAIAYDPTHSRAVVYGGQTADDYWTCTGNYNLATSNTWLWDGTAWAQAHPLHSPPATQSSAMAYDATLGEMILFGGAESAGGVGVGTYPAGNSTVFANTYIPISDTWAWNGTDWTLLSPAHSPPARYGAAVAADDARGSIVIFGGEGAQGVALGDTWEWKNGDWTQLNSATSIAPAPRSFASMAYLPSPSQLIMVNGDSASGSALAETWLFTGSGWSQYTQPRAIQPRYGSGFTYDAALGKLFLYGGQNQSGGQEYGIFYWDGVHWTLAQPPTGPPARAFEQMIYFPPAGSVLMFGGEHGTYLCKSGSGISSLVNFANSVYEQLGDQWTW
ncbi:MAG: Kelch repeat-containing protein [Candidatus Dormibacteria bacterium]